jgi:hypothetical protein
MMSTIQALSPVVFFCIMIFLLAAGGILLVAGMRARRRAALIGAMPTSNIGMAADGYCELEGRIEIIEGHPITAPLTHAPCAWYRARVERWIPGRRDSMGRWSVVRDETSSSPFLVRDATGVCAVYPHGAEVTPTDTSKWSGADAAPTDRNPPRYAPTDVVPPDTEFGGTGYRYLEERIYVGDPLLVLGEFHTGRFDAAADDDDVDDEPDLDEQSAGGDVSDIDAGDVADDGATAADDGGDGDEDDDDDAAALAAERVTSAWVARGAGTRPFIMTTTLQAVHVAMSDTGAQTALSMAPVPFLVAAFLAWARYA